VLHVLYASANITEIKDDEAGEHEACMKEMRNMYKILVEKSEGKKPLGRPRCRWEDNIKLDLKEIEWDDTG
jgi:hypothetical protein